LTFVKSGETQSFVYSRRDSKLPFLKLWSFLSAFCTETTSLKKDLQEMEKLFIEKQQENTSIVKILLLFVNQSVMGRVTLKNV
jgi:hypothetical protein